MQREMPQHLLVLRYPLRRRRLILGHLVKSCTPLEACYNFVFIFCILTVYMHIFEITLSKKKLILKKIDFRVQSPHKHVTTLLHYILCQLRCGGQTMTFGHITYLIVNVSKIATLKGY